MKLASLLRFTSSIQDPQVDTNESIQILISMSRFYGNPCCCHGNIPKVCFTSLGICKSRLHRRKLFSVTGGFSGGPKTVWQLRNGEDDKAGWPRQPLCIQNPVQEEIAIPISESVPDKTMTSISTSIHPSIHSYSIVYTYRHTGISQIFLTYYTFTDWWSNGPLTCRFATGGTTTSLCVRPLERLEMELKIIDPRFGTMSFI